ncbi:hypothetical protein AB4182_08545 [Vibrio splendidus]
MAIEIGKIITRGNQRDGVRLPKDTDLKVDEIHAVDNGGDGFNVIDTDNLLDKLGLPQDTNLQELSELLNILRTIESKEEQFEIVKNSSFFDQISSAVLNSTTLVANIVTAASIPQVQQIISNLLGK